MTGPEHLDRLDAFIVELNSAAGKAILPYFRDELGLQNKNPHGAYDPVTAADKAAEAAIRRLIGDRYPAHGVIGEEYGEDRADAEFVWVIDPIDGTRAFVAGLPVWTVLIGLRFGGSPMLGSIGQPFLGEQFIGGGGQARLASPSGERRLTCRKGVPLADAVIATTDPHGCFTRPEMAAWRQVRAASRIARLGCDAYAYAMVAAASIDLVLEAGLACWDVEAAIPIIEGAGGTICDWRGAQIGDCGGRIAIAGSQELMDQVLPLLEAAQP
ncbi:MAG: histidinol-phosphatase [Caulobacteraceae bacterium]